MPERARDFDELLAEVCLLTARSPRADDAVQGIADLLAAHLGSWVFEVWLSRNGDSFDLLARTVSEAIPAERRRKLSDTPSRVLFTDETPASSVARTGQKHTWTAEDPELDPLSRQNLTSLEASEITALPIVDDGTMLGVAVVTPPPETSVGEEAEQVLGVVLRNLALLLHKIHRLEVEKEEAAVRSRLETAIDSLPVVVKLLSPDWVIEYVNPAVEDVLGYSPDELLGRSISHIREIEGGDSPQAEVADAVQKGVWTGDLLDRHKDGRTVPVRLVVAPVRDAEDLVVGIVEIARDLSRELAQERRAKTAYRMAAVGHLAASVAHEVNNPLAAITMLTRVLLGGTLPDDLRQDLELINSEAHRAGSISRNLLAFARQSGVQKQSVDVEPVVREVVRLKLPELRLGQIAVEIEVSDDVPPARANAGHIRQILHNLVSNAAQAIEEEKDQGRIRIAISPAGSEWLDIVVEDDGPGIPEEVLDRIMEPFFTTKAMGRGTGLGLSVSRDLVEDHGGELRVENRVSDGGGSGTGARVFLRLPAMGREESGGSVPGARSVSTIESGRILVVDDDLAVASALKRLLERLGHAAEVEHRGEGGVRRIIDEEHFDAILCDLNMPGMGGEGVYRRIEELRPTLVERLIFMSGELTPRDDNEFLRERPFSTLEKPFTPDQLQDAIDSVMKGGDD